MSRSMGILHIVRLLQPPRKIECTVNGLRFAMPTGSAHTRALVLVQADKLDSQWRHGRSRPEPGRRLSKGLSWNAEEDDTR